MLIDSLHQVGGMELQARRLAEVVRRTHDIDVFFLSNVPAACVAELAPIRLVRFSPIGILRRLFGPLALAHLLRLRHRIDVVHGHQLQSAGWVAALFAQIVGCPSVVKAACGGHNGDVANLAQSKIPRIKRWALRHATRVVALTPEIRQELRDYGICESRLLSIPNGVDTHLFCPPETNAATSKQALGLECAPLVVFAGRLHPDKRVHFILRAWPAIVARHQSAQLAILGQGPDEQALRDLATASRIGNVRFFGVVENVHEFLRAADVFVLPSSTEGLSNTTLEAMASGVPVVCSRIGGFVTLVRHGVDGFLFARENVDDLANCVVALLDDPQRARRMGAAGRQLVTERYSLDAVGDRYGKLYRTLYNRQASRCAS